MVDVSWIPILHRSAIVEAETGIDLFAGYPRLKAWRRAVLGFGVADKSVADDFESEFSAFYFANSTYLGKLAQSRRVSAAGKLM